MAPPYFPSAKLTLSYPLYACDFDPQDPNTLVVGGGGGPGRSGVGNKITVLNANTTSDLTVAGEATLSRDEDSVSSLAVGPRRGRSTTLIYAGVNSSPAEVAKGKNEHMRVFALETTKARGGGAGASVTGSNVAEVSRSSLFTATHPETYQRVLRLGPPSTTSGMQIGAAASGLGKEFQIALFETAQGGGGGGQGALAPKARGVLELKRQADDLDIVQTGGDEYQLAFCHEYELYTMNIKKGVGEDPKLVYETPHDVGTGAPRAQFRSIRYLTPNFLLAVANLPKRSGVLLQAFRLPAKPDERARIAAQTRLPRKVAQATALAARNLSPPATPGGKVDRAQFVIAVAGHDSSISLYTLEHKALESVNLLADLYPLATLRDDHPLNITGLAFSPFTPPPRTSAAGPGPSPASKPQVIKLASISMGNTVVVHAIPLKKAVDKSVPVRRGGPPRPVRYVVAAQSQRPSSKGLVTALTLIVLVLAIVGQGILELTGRSKPVLGAARYFNPYGTLRPHHDEFIQRVLAGTAFEPRQRVVLRDESGAAEDAAPLQVNVAAEGEVAGDAREWEELPEGEKGLWKEKLRKKGLWAEEMGEAVFKGVLFGEIAGMVGRAMA